MHVKGFFSSLLDNFLPLWLQQGIPREKAPLSRGNKEVVIVGAEKEKDSRTAKKSMLRGLSVHKVLCQILSD